MSWNDPCVVQATRTGDWPAELLAEYTERFEPLVRVATMMLGSRGEAEEVVQEAFIATARNWWTGDEIIVWGGATTEFAGPDNLATLSLRDGALYRP